jgi:hypothetical protein
MTLTAFDVCTLLWYSHEPIRRDYGIFVILQFTRAFILRYGAIVTSGPSSTKSYARGPGDDGQEGLQASCGGSSGCMQHDSRLAPQRRAWSGPRARPRRSELGAPLHALGMMLRVRAMLGGAAVEGAGLRWGKATPRTFRLQQAERELLLTTTLRRPTVNPTTATFSLQESAAALQEQPARAPEPAITASSRRHGR